MCITSDTENLDGVTHLIESIILQRKSQGLPKYQKQRIILIQQALGLWNASMEKWNRFGYHWKKYFAIMKLIYNGLNKKNIPEDLQSNVVKVKRILRKTR